MDAYLPAVRKADIRALGANQSIFGGNANSYTLVELQRNFAELDKGPLAGRVLKPEEVEKMFQKMPEGTVKNVNIVVAKFQPELSILGEPPGNE
ncbi:MAG: hypothetical protein KIS76_18920 [Pyrinomonadaceae bacterium]|nr:hypothetical protein [Pyrinomonadaceae bacterium]